jgi:hypothetical protein
MIRAKVFAASVVAMALGAVAAPALSGTVLFADYDTGASNARNFRFVNGGSGDSDSAALYTISSPSGVVPGATDVRFSFFDDPALPDFFQLAALFTFQASVTDTPALYDGVTYTQTGLDGSFQFVYNGPTGVVDGFSLIKGVSVLFSGTFDNAWLTGRGGVGGVQLSGSNGGTATYSSAYYDVAAFHDDEFTFHLGAIGPVVSRANATSALNSFRAHVAGEFQGVVPEPAAWALMIVGFGGAGAALRRNRRRVTA